MAENNDTSIAQYIEQTLLKPDTTKEQVKKLLEDAIQEGFTGVCIPPYYVKYSREILGDSPIKLVTVVGFPLGYQLISSKMEETKKAIEDGADEIDMVINIAAVKSGEYNHVKDGIEGVATFCRLKAKPIKVIIETCLLDDTEMLKVCEILEEIGVDYVKTSTGMNGEGATVENILKLREWLPSRIRIKASGGIKTLESARELVKAGALRLGTSSGMKIVEEEKAESR